MLDLIAQGLLLAGLVSSQANGESQEPASFRQEAKALLRGHTMAVAYSGFREGQHPDRGSGGVYPSKQETLEDLQLLTAEGFRLIRLYDSGVNSKLVLEVIRENKLPIEVLLGAWLQAEVSNHEGCPWLTAPIPEEELRANAKGNAEEVQRCIDLAKQYPRIVAAVNIGNEALVEWNDHMVPLPQVLAYVKRTRAAIEQPVTVAENYRWWIDHGAPLAKELDFIGVHSYPLWEGFGINDGLRYTLENVRDVHAALPDAPMALLEVGWATQASEFAERASEAAQSRYFNELKAWSAQSNTTVFFFEAFDEPWKGGPGNPLGAEKHWGLWFVDRTPKAVLRRD